MTDLATVEQGDVLEQVVAQGDLANLSPQERAVFYARVCESVGLNPLTQPFAYIRLSGKLTLYARKDATDQLRKLNGVSISKPSVTYQDDLIIVSVEARDKTGRTDADVGVVHLGKLAGDARANAIMKAVTKSKRRVTLSICGLGFLDETEIETIRDAEPFEEATAAADSVPPGGQTWLRRDQQDALHQLGASFYGPLWDVQRERLVAHVTHNRTSRSDELSQGEAERLIAGLKARVRERQEVAPEPA